MLISPATPKLAAEGSASSKACCPSSSSSWSFMSCSCRPQQRKAKQHRELVASVRRGDVIVTGGGVVGKVTKVGETDDNHGGDRRGCPRPGRQGYPFRRAEQDGTRQGRRAGRGGAHNRAAARWAACSDRSGSVANGANSQRGRTPGRRMLYFAKWKTGSSWFFALWGLVFAAPNFVSERSAASLPTWLPHKQINLGLDLQAARTCWLGGGRSMPVIVERLEVPDRLRSAPNSAANASATPVLGVRMVGR